MNEELEGKYVERSSLEKRRTSTPKRKLFDDEGNFLIFLTLLFMFIREYFEIKDMYKNKFTIYNKILKTNSL